MFTNKDIRLLSDGYFTIIRVEERFIEVLSNNTSHQWMIFKKLSATDKPVTLYHKHTADTKYYHKHWETWNVARAVESIKGHDTYIIEKGKGSGRYGRI